MVSLNISHVACSCGWIFGYCEIQESTPFCDHISGINFCSLWLIYFNLFSNLLGLQTAAANLPLIFCSTRNPYLYPRHSYLRTMIACRDNEQQITLVIAPNLFSHDQLVCMYLMQIVFQLGTPHTPQEVSDELCAAQLSPSIKQYNNNNYYYYY